MTSPLPIVLALEGASNVRDLGGWPVAGGRVRRGLVFRAAALSDLTPADGARLAALGLRSVCDLRGPREAAAAPSRLEGIPGVTRYPLPIEPTVGASLRDILATRAATGADTFALMHEAYVAYARDWAHRYRTLFALLGAEAAGPLLFHCSAGKDRTGFGAALILTVLGAARATVMADYLATNRLWRGDAMIAEGLPAEAAEPLLRVAPALLDAAFAAIDTLAGDFDSYAGEYLGLTPALRERLRERLVEPGGGGEG